MTSRAYESENYDKHTSRNWLYRKHLDSFYEELFDVVAKTGCETLLDAGCGEGFVIDFLARRDPELKLTGIDVNAEAIEHARTRFGERGRFRTGSVYKLPFSDRSFDTVLCSEVLEHLEDPSRAVKELRRVARKYVVITVPHEPYFRWLNKLGQVLGTNPDPGHVNFWTSKTFQAFVRAHFDDPTCRRKQLYQIAVAAV